MPWRELSGNGPMEEVQLPDGSVVTLRSPVPEDAEKLLGYLDAVRRETEWLEFGPRDPLPSVEQERAWITRMTSGDRARQILVEADGQPVALAGVSPTSAFDRLRHMVTFGISVRRDFWGRGIGRMLGERLLDWCRGHADVRRVVLGVHGDNPRARAMYGAMGFVEDGAIPGSIARDDGTFVDQVRMSCWVGDEPELGSVLRLPAGEGLALRAVRLSDAEPLFALIRKNRAHLRPWFRWPLTVETVGDVRGQIERWSRAEAASGTVTFLLWRETELLGVVMLHGHLPDDRAVELGCWLDEGAQGRGVASRACRVVVQWAFETLDVARVEMTAQSENVKSLALGERLGFTREGVRRSAQVWGDGEPRDLVVMSRLASDPSPNAESRTGTESGFAPRVIELANGRQVAVRAAVPDDAQAMLDYMRGSIDEVTQFIMTTPEEFTYTLTQERAMIAGVDPAAGELWLMAFDGERVVGSLNCHTLKRKRRAHVGQLGMTLEADYRGQGLGTAMLGALVDWAERHPVLEMLLLSVYADNARAISLYRRCGFVEAGRVPQETKFGPDDYRDEVTMWRDVSGSAARSAGE